ncbi:Auxin-responsive protein IAA19 [Bienertia sinuspersici]
MMFYTLIEMHKMVRILLVLENNNAHKLALLKDMDVPSSPKPVHCSINYYGHPIYNRAQVMGWPPIRSYRKNNLASKSAKKNEKSEEKSVTACLYVMGFNGGAVGFQIF